MAIAPNLNGSITLSIVIPIYNEEANLSHLFERVLNSVQGLNITYEIICINDGSRDNSLDQLIHYHKENSAIKIINFSRNFGKDIALSAGLDYACGAAVIPLDADLQDPPELMTHLLEKWRQGYDVVYATRRDRQGESWLKRVSSQRFYRLLGRVSDVPIPQDTGDFRLMDRRVVEALKQLPERNRFMKGLFAWVGYRQVAIEYDRPPRYAGRSKWNYWQLWNFALDGITAFSLIPLKVWSYLGLGISILALVYAIFLVIRTLIYGIDVPGYASLMVAVLFMGGVQLISLGVIGEYLGRVYEEVKGRPLYLVRDLYGFEGKNQLEGGELVPLRGGGISRLRSRRHLSVLILVLLLTTALMMYGLGRLEMDLMRAWLEEAGWWAPVLYLVLYSLGTLLLLPSTPLNLMGGALFGTGWGTVWTSVGAMLAAILAFWLSRHLGRGAIAGRLQGRWQALDAELQQGGMWYLFAIRLLPIIPYGLVNIAAGLSGISSGDYLLGTALGTVPGIFPIVWLGSAGVQALETGELLPLFGALSLIGLLMLGATIYQRRRRFPWDDAHEASKDRNRP